MAKRPAGLIFAVDERPPAPALALLAIQHIMLMASSLVLPIVLVSEVSGNPAQVRAVVAASMIACGIGTMVQATRFLGIGSGFLCPNLCGPNFFAVSMSAAWAGGLPLMRGMTIAAGLVEVAFGRLLPRLAFLFPTEITGLVVLMVAIGMVPLGASKFLHVSYAGEPIQLVSLLIAVAALAVMVGANVWGGRRLRLYGVLLGSLLGYGLSILAGLLTPVELGHVAAAPWIGLPAYEGFWNISFSWSLLPAFAIASICGGLKSVGNLVLCEKVNDDDWRAPDLRRIGDGLVADAISVTASGLLGGLASDTSASNVAMSSASGATSRWIGIAAGALFALLGFSPKLAALLSIMPIPVAGAILVFSACFMIWSGLQIIIGSKPDNRRVFVIGMSLYFGLSLDILPQLYGDVGPTLRPLFDSSLTLATVMAVLLNQLLRIVPPRGEAAPPAGD
ncbi:MAG: solute carrier family 23 protein [Dongiaceae bacterium]